MTWPTLLVALAIGAVILLSRRGGGGGALFVVRVRRGRVELSGPVPGHTPRAIHDFFADLRLPSGATVRAYPDDVRFRLDFSPEVPADERQRIRNFLYLHV